MERLVVASLVPFKHYVRLRRTGKSWIVYYDGNKVTLRSSLLPRPKEPLDIRYSRTRIRKKYGLTLNKRLEILRKLLSENSYRAYRLALRVSKLWKRGRVRTFLKSIRREIFKKIKRGSIVKKISKVFKAVKTIASVFRPSRRFSRRRPLP